MRLGRAESAAAFARSAVGVRSSSAATPTEFDGLSIVRALGRGATGDVFLAREPALGRDVAVKVLRDGVAADWMNEARIIGGLHYPGIVALHRVGVVVGRPYLVYELVPGQPLSRATCPMPPLRALAIGRDLAAALAAVHDAGVVHGDVKPSNVMLAPDPVRSTGELTTLIDFGIARTALAPGRAGLGTPLYMAPELSARSRATSATDVYALALVVVEMLTGAPRAHELDALASRGVPEKLVASLTRCLASDPAQRPSAAELYRSLDWAAHAVRTPAASARPAPRPEIVPAEKRSLAAREPFVDVRSARGRIFSARIGPNAAYFYFEGHIDLELFGETMGPALAATEAGKALLFGDGENWQTYAVGYRDAWTRWLLERRDLITRTHLVIRSPILRMGVQVVNLFTGGAITDVESAAVLSAKMRSTTDVATASRSWPRDMAARVRS